MYYEIKPVKYDGLYSFIGDTSQIIQAYRTQTIVRNLSHEPSLRAVPDQLGRLKEINNLG